MIEHIATLTCLHSIVSNETGNLTLIEIIEEFSIEKSIFLDSGNTVNLGNFEVVSLWRRTKLFQPTQGYSRLIIVSPSSQIILEQEYEIDLHTNQRCNTILQIRGLKVQEIGNYECNVQLLDENEKKWISMVNIMLPISFKKTSFVCDKRDTFSDAPAGKLG